jgi:hypothetical protein
MQNPLSMAMTEMQPVCFRRINHTASKLDPSCGQVRCLHKWTIGQLESGHMAEIARGKATPETDKSARSNVTVR